MFYGARWYDPSIGHFLQADTIIPNPWNPLDFDRYAYGRNNPIKYSDPSGHECFNTGAGVICSDDTGAGGAKGVSAFHTSLLVNKASDLDGKYGIRAQYMAVDSPIYRFQYQNELHLNLCGHLSAAAIYETETGRTKTIGMIWDNVQTAPFKGFRKAWLSSSSDWTGFFNNTPG